MKKLCCAICMLACALSLLSPALAGSNRPVRVGFFAFEGYHMTEEDGSRSGYGYDYLQYMARYTDWTYEYLGYAKSWSEALDMLRNGEIDLLTSARKTPEREAEFDFSAYPMGTSAAILTVRAGESKYLVGNYAGFDGIRVGLLKDNSRNESLAAFAGEKGFSYTPVYYESADELTAALQKGEEVDAIVTSNLRATKNEWIIARFDPSPFYVIVRKGSGELLQQADHAMEQLENDEPLLQTELFSKYYSADNGNDVPFTDSERQYINESIKENRVITALMIPAREPVSWFENGAARGIVADVAQRIGSLSGLNISIRETGSWEEYYSIISEGETDLVMDFSGGATLAEELGYKLTDSYLELPYVEMSLKGADLSRDDCIAGVYQISDITDRYVEQRYQPERIIYYTDSEKMLNDLKKGKIDVCYLSEYVAGRAAYEDIAGRMSAVRLYNGNSAHYAIAVNNKMDVRMVSILSKSINGLGENAVEDIAAKQTGYPSKPFSIVGYLYSRPIAAMALIAAVVIFLGVWLTLYLRRREKKRISELQEHYDRLDRAKEKRLSEIVMHEYDYATTINLNTMRYTNENLTGGAEVFPTAENGDYAAEFERFCRERSDPSDLGALLAYHSPEGLCAELGSPRREPPSVLYRIKDGNRVRWMRSAIYFAQADGEKYAYIFNKDVTREIAARRALWQAEREKEQQLADLQRMRDSLQDALSEARSASNAKGQFLSQISHEIRTPLNAIIGYMTIAESNPNDADKMWDCLQKSKAAAHHLLSIINDVLDMASIESGKTRIASESFDFKQLIGGIRDIFYAQAVKKGIKFEVWLQELTEESLIGDSLRVSQILQNLLSNAIKFTPEGGSVTLVVRQKTIQQGTVYLHFEVRDTGIGMDKAFMERLFQPFEQQSASTARQYGGTGLGLAITHNLVSMMNGSISAESEQGRGTTMCVDLPFGEDAEAERLSEEPYDFSQLHALIVNSEPSMVEYTSIVVSRCGVRNDAASSTNEALERIRLAKESGEPYNMYLIGWVMPNMDSAGLIRSIRAGDGESRLLVVVTAYDSMSIETSAKEAGADVVISEPIFQSNFFNLLVNTCGKRIPKLSGDKNRPDFTGRRLLLAEDNEMNMEIACELLRGAGFEVETAENGLKAMEMFEGSPRHWYDAVLMDVMMPVLNGYDATKRIRASEHPDAKSIPIIAMTANAFQEDVADALAAGMNDHIAKPIEIATLFKTLKNYLE